MPIDVPRLRTWFAVAAISLLVLVAGFYFYPKLKNRRTVQTSEPQLSSNVQQSTKGFSLSKSEGGHTLFTVRAAQAIQYKEGRAELQDVNIVIYGHESNRFDQIYGSQFEYDPQAGNVRARGVVHIDLQSDTGGAGHPDQAPPQELKNPIHLLAHGLVFNEKTGNARTDEGIEFRVPQASGTATGADYDPQHNQLVLRSDVHIATSGPDAATITARSGLIAKNPRRAVLYDAHIRREASSTDVGELTVYLREDNSVDHVTAAGGVQSETRGPTTLHMRAPQAVVYTHGKNNDLRVANVTGGAVFDASGANTMNGSANTVTVTFKGHHDVDQVRAEGNVKLVQPPKANAGAVPEGRAASRAAVPGAQSQTIEMVADTVNFHVEHGQFLRRAETAGNAQIVLTPAEKGGGGLGTTPTSAKPGQMWGTNARGERTVVTAGKFDAAFENNRIQSLTGMPDARVVSSVPGEADKVSTSRTIEAAFNPGGGIASLVQRDNFHYQEALANGTQRAAWADWATYSPGTETLTLNGHPRIVEGGMTATAKVVRINRTGDATAQDDVKTTYSELKPQPGGALLASSDPIHVTARSMTAQRSTGLAHYAGDARLWQGANIVEAPVIDFDRERRTVTAYANGGRIAEVPRGRSPEPQRQVQTILVQQDKSGKLTPVNITAARLTYADNERLARFEGGVTVHGADGTLTARQVDVYLRPATSTTGATPKPASFSMSAAGPSQVDRIVASGNVIVQQANRRATGQKLVYTAADDKSVMTGGPPSIFDAEHGTITGSSLTFYTRDDRVLVEGGNGTRTVTTTRVSK